VAPIATSREHLVTIAAAIVLAGGAQVLWLAFASPAARTLAVGGLVAGLAGCLGASWTVRRYLFEPCGVHDLHLDDEVLKLGAVPTDLKSWIRAKDEGCAAGAHASIVESFTAISWDPGWFGVDPAGGGPYRWTGAHSVTLVTRRARGVTLTMRQPDATAAAPVEVAIVADGVGQRVRLTSPEWVRVDVPFGTSVLAWLRQAHRIDIDVTPPPGRDRLPGVALAPIRVY
jgi:hypothetical protein